MAGVELKVERAAGVFFHQAGRAIQDAARSQGNLSRCVGSCRRMEALCRNQSCALLIHAGLNQQPHRVDEQFPYRKGNNSCGNLTLACPTTLLFLPGRGCLDAALGSCLHGWSYFESGWSREEERVYRRSEDAVKVPRIWKARGKSRARVPVPERPN